MAELSIKPEYRPYVDAVIERLRANRLTLSPYSEMLLCLSVEAWFEEPPQTKDYARWLPKSPFVSSVSEKKQLLEILLARIIEEAIREPHIEINKRKNSAVPFVFFIYALAECGRDVLESWVLKN